jgi:hypothetical protein
VRTQDEASEKVRKIAVREREEVRKIDLSR